MTLEEVARFANVSTATVSRVLNNPQCVREDTRKRVRHAIDELQYQPNPHARSLASTASHTIGVIVSNIENPFFLDIFCVLEARARERGYAVSLEQTGYMPDRLVQSVRSLLALRPVGLAMIVSEMDAAVTEEIASRGIPAAIYDVGHPSENITQVRVRYELGVRRIVEYLYSMGHRRIAFVGHHAGLAPLDARRETFLDVMRKHARAAQAQTVEADDNPASARAAARSLFASGFKPSAIVCANDFMALGVLRAVRDEGLSSPADVSVTGFDNIELASYANPALTTVEVPRRRIGELCIDALLRPVGARADADRSIVIDPELVVRESTGVARA